jgi:tRNA pseudouridine38-40 synthase
MKTKYAIRLAYDGTDFCGWQTQRGVGKHANAMPAIEETIVAAIRDLCGEEVTVTGSGRTDAGVHASGQIAHFRLETECFPVENLRQGLNFRLPDCVRILQLGAVPDAFHARRTLAKQYSYYFQVGPVNLPHLQRYTMWCRRPLDGGAMGEAVRSLLGEHDFSPFASARSGAVSPVREIREAAVTCEPLAWPGAFPDGQTAVWRLRLVGSGFLKQMVRGIAGTLKLVGEGRRPAEDFAAILASGDRQAAGPTAPASGLWLERVWYPEQEGIGFLEE